MASLADSTCLNPQPPNWAWRYNRTKKLLEFLPWTTRLERWPPYYRHMGLASNFRFHRLGSGEVGRHFQQLGANYAHDLVNSRQTGSGNASLGHPPGPAPPRLVVYDIQNPYRQDDLYKVNEIHNISQGMSLLNYSSIPRSESDVSRVPLNPRQYLELTLNQLQAYPGTFPHYNAPVPTVSHRCERVCGAKTDEALLSPLMLWQHKQKAQEAMHSGSSRQNGRP